VAHWGMGRSGRGMSPATRVNGSMHLLFLAILLATLRLVAVEPYAWDNAQLHGMGFVTGVVVHPTADRIYLRTDVGGVYLRDEAAGRWWNLTDKNRAIDTNIESIAVIPTVPDGVVFAASDTVWRSLDAGATWTDTGLNTPMRGNGERRRGGERLAVDPLRADRMWFGSRTAGLWAWNGTAWSTVAVVPLGSQDPDVTHVPAWPSQCFGVCWVAVDPTGGNATTGSQIIYAGVEGSGVWRTLNGGANWAMIPGSPGNGDGNHPIRGQVVAGKLITTWTAGGILDAAASGGGAWRWDGAAWTQLMSNTRRCAIAANADGSELVLGGFDTTPTFLSRSLNGGAFTTITLSSPSVPGWWPSFYPYGWGAGAAFDPRRPGELWYTDGFGPYRIRNFGTAQQTVTAEMHGVEELVLQMLSADPKRGIVAGCADMFGLKVNDPEVVPSAAIVPNQFGITTGLDRCAARPDTVVIVGSDENNGNPVHRVSHDGGSSWAAFTNPNPAKSYAGVWDGVVAVSAGNPLNWVWYPNTASWAENAKGAIGSYVTRNGGASWTATTGLPSFISDVGNHWNVARLVIADGAREGVFYCISGNNGIANFYRSTNGGVTWSQVAYTGSIYKWSWQMSLYAVPGVADELWITYGKGSRKNNLSH
jgi:xyloglucan-specific exo-beta-1,4-glucanase